MIWVIAIISIIIIALIYNHTIMEEVQPVIIPENVISDKVIAESKSIQPDSSFILGRWKRLDGGYVIEIRKADIKGRLDVSYFNPNPINVGRALWTIKDNRLIVMVELKDDNYPGSTYGLEYVQKEDKLYGKYFQAVEQKTYDVVFEREK